MDELNLRMLMKQNIAYNQPMFPSVFIIVETIETCKVDSNFAVSAHRPKISVTDLYTNFIVTNHTTTENVHYDTAKKVIQSSTCT
jgi:hypothetical protein